MLVDAFVGVDEASMERLTKLIGARDNEGVMQMILQDRAFMLTKGIRVRMIDPGIITSEVRALDGPCSGRSGLIPAEFAGR